MAAKRGAAEWLCLVILAANQPVRERSVLEIHRIS
jgi:hypothetical protein